MACVYRCVRARKARVDVYLVEVRQRRKGDEEKRNPTGREEGAIIVLYHTEVRQMGSRSSAVTLVV